ncbi:MAG TPA: O-antigen ligase family protein [Steroidobacteraceae bacterium]|nr:O-antigen ligase family protein [Steroidobacteraceae bacterium]
MRALLVLLISVLAVSDILHTGLSLGPGLSVKNALLYPIALGLLFRMALTGRFRMRLPAVNAAFVVWIAYALLTWIACVTFLHYPGYHALHYGVELKSVLIDAALFFFTYFYGIESEQDYLLMARTLAFWIGLANILTLGDLAGIVPLHVTIGQGGVEADRVFGVFGHANDTGALIVCLLPLMVAVAVSSRSLARLYWYAGAFASIAVLILTVSRGAFVGLAAGYAAGVWLCRRYLPTSKVVAWGLIGLTCAVIAGGVAAALMPNMAQVLAQRLFNQSMASSIGEASSGRTTIWLRAIDTMMAHPITLLTGYGWDVYHTMFVLVTHNFYLDQWFGLGLVGLFAFLTILYQTLRTARRAIAAEAGPLRPYMIAFVFGMLGIMVCIFFVNLNRPWSYVWVFMGFSLRAAADLVEKSERSASRRAQRAPAAPVRRPATAQPRAATARQVADRRLSPN